MIALSGFIATIGFLVNLEEVLVLPILLVLLVWYRKSFRLPDLAAFFGAVALAVLIMALIGVALANNPLAIYKSSAPTTEFCTHIRQCGNHIALYLYVNDLLPNGAPAVNHLLSYLNINYQINPISGYDTNSPYYYGLFFYFALAAMAYLALRKEKRVLILAVWAILMLLYLGLGSTSFTYYTRGVWYALPRYTLLFWPALMLIIGCAMDSVMVSAEKYAPKREHKTRATILRVVVYSIFIVAVAGLFVQSIKSIAFLGAQQYGVEYELIEAGNYVNGLPSNAMVYIGYDLPIGAYTNMQHNLGLFYSAPECGQMTDGSYLISRYNATLASACNLSLVYSAPPPPANGAVFRAFNVSYLDYKNITAYYKR